MDEIRLLGETLPGLRTTPSVGSETGRSWLAPAKVCNVWNMESKTLFNVTNVLLRLPHRV